MKTHFCSNLRSPLNGRRILASIAIMSCLASASAQETSVTLSVDAKPALVLKAPAAAKVLSTNGFVRIQATNLTLYVWAVPNAKTVSDALPRAADIIKSEFLKFKTNAVMDMTVAGAPAKHLTGSGNEADDGDPGNAEVVMFTVGGRVFAGCVHGEADDASKARAAMLTVLKTAQAAP
jgi:hypothetical protein